MTGPWRQHAACRGIDPEIFHPPSEEEAELAKAICARCMVREPCLQHALSHREPEGVWGGTTGKERRRLLRRQRRPA
ncbi:MAG TPA: WhiB family transcriptional regulator [Acidimicrobiales bacterium]|nr:WhiB family transcriptional regulator [Acidimicrobiales bacterium]